MTTRTWYFAKLALLYHIYRNVYISKLRNLMEKVGGVHILSQNSFWSVQFDDGTLCDYLEALRLYEENSSQNLEKLIELLLRGMILPNMK